MATNVTPPLKVAKERQKLTPLKTMERIVRLLGDLTPEQRKRVLAYVNAECADESGGAQ